ncbi:MAG: helix-turn-helix transcriptional regulator [Acidimicrobiaceae bacterium]|nr:helix-turn-helix transcriptional regulator [Acidimicrobiaceae bacterium]
MSTAQAQTSATSPQIDRSVYARDTTASRAPAIAALNNAYGGLTGRVRVLSEDVAAGRRDVRTLDLEERTGTKALLSTAALLDELAVERGLAWSDVARLCSVSVSAIRKWRSGESPSPERRRSLARLAAFLDLLEQAGPVADPAGWLFMRLAEGCTATAADLYDAGRGDDLLEHAQGHLNLNDILDRWNPEWRTDTRSDWKVTSNSEGDRVLTRRA